MKVHEKAIALIRLFIVYLFLFNNSGMLDKIPLLYTRNINLISYSVCFLFIDFKSAFSRQ